MRKAQNPLIMARVGTNPNRHKPFPLKLTDVVLACVTHLPNTNGYHKNRLEIVQKCLTSMRKNAGSNYSVIVWDNGSCDKLREWVEREYKPDIFIKSNNIGKSIARAAIFGMLKPNTIVNFSDDDIYYYPNWLAPQIKLLKHFLDVSSVTGYPVRTAFQWGNENTISRLKPEYGRFLPRSWESDYARSIGVDPDDHAHNTKHEMDIIVEYKGMRAYATSHHCQHIGRAGLLGQAARETMTHTFVPNEKPYDIALDKIGNRLATLERYTRHMGNIIDDKLRRDIFEAEKTKIINEAVSI